MQTFVVDALLVLFRYIYHHKMENLGDLVGCLNHTTVHTIGDLPLCTSFFDLIQGCGVGLVENFMDFH